MIWGYATPWFGQFIGDADDQLMVKLQFLVDHDLQATHIGMKEIAAMDEARRRRIGEFLEANDLRLVPTVWFDYLDQDVAALRRNMDEAIAAIQESAELLRAPIITTGVGRYHRFMREPSFAEQMARLPEALAPLAQACHDLGRPLGIENHGDYYCSDLVTLCEQTPHLRIFLDTGNTYLIGEQSLPGIRAAAPLTIGTHFKDHHVQPRKRARPLHFEIAGAVIGEGDVGLAEAYQILCDSAPDPDKLVMLLEMIPPEGMDPVACLERSLAFVRGLEEGAA
ncbi:MAG: sugar phosphate isomerase/epimerase family protein [Armatimonadota bacterium]